VFGDSYPNVIKPEAKINGKTTPFYKAGLVAAERFGRKASGPEEVIERLQELFPDQPATWHEIPALQIAKQTDAFVRKTPENILTCPAVDMTGALFKAYGKLLRNPDYQNHLIQKMRYPIYRRYAF